MSKIEITISNNQPQLEKAIQKFVNDVFNQQEEFLQLVQEKKSHKAIDPNDIIETVYQILVFKRIYKNTKSLVTRKEVMDAVKELSVAFKNSKIAVYMKTAVKKTMEISKKNPNELTDLILGLFNNDNDNDEE